LGTGADFSDVGMIRVGIDAAMSATDVLIDTINTVFVPEPASFILAGIGLVGIMLTRRHRETLRTTIE